MVASINALVQTHGIWDSKLLWACRKGLLSKGELAYFVGQYAHYSRNFTRGLAGCMANLQNDLWRSQLSENLWEEAGEADPTKRHSELFRRFLVYLGVDRDGIVLAPETKLFVMEWLQGCSQPDSLGAVAHLSFGTEGIVSRLYQCLVSGFTQAGVPEEELRFFHLHIACDDAHAETLNAIASALISDEHSLKRAKRATIAALDSRMNFFNAIFERLRWMRIEGKMNAIQGKESLVGPAPQARRHLTSTGNSAIVAYANQNPKLGIDFRVEHLSFSSEVLDTRIVRIAPRATNERHRHAHETIYHVVSGTGTVSINDTTMEVGPGDVAFIPRWAFHQAINKGDEPLVILTVTDYNLTGKAYFGNYMKTARLDQSLADVATGGLHRGASHDPALLGSTLDIILNRQPDFASEVYGRLFEAHPSSRALFGREGQEAQGRLLTSTLTALVDHVDDAPWVMQTLRTLGTRHKGLGVEPHIYPWVGDALLSTFADIMGKDWSGEIEAAWRALYDEATSIISEAPAPTPKP